MDASASDCGATELSSLDRGQITVVITTHNYGRYLAWCIHSALEQTVRPARVIVVDDASDDNSRDVASKYTPLIEYHRVAFRNPQRARNFGLQKVSSEYVLFLDADNYMSDNMLEQLKHALESHPEARVAYSDKCVFGDPASMNRLRLGHYWKADEFSLDTLRFRNFIDLNSLVRRAYLTGFDDRIRRLQDWDTWLGILKANDHAVRVPQPLLHYRVHGENLSFRRRELVERLKVMVKHALIDLHLAGATALPNEALQRRGEIVVLTMRTHESSLDPWHALALTTGCRLRVIVGTPPANGSSGLRVDSITRDRDVIVQTAFGEELDDLFWRFAGTTFRRPCDRRRRRGERDRNFKRRSTRRGEKPVIRSALDLKSLLAASSLEDLGTFVLSPRAVRLLLYLPRLTEPTMIGRLRRLGSQLLSKHVTWRLRRARSATGTSGA